MSIDLTPPAFLAPELVANANATIEFETGSAYTTDANGFTRAGATSTESLRAIIHQEVTRNRMDVFPDGKDIDGEMIRGRLTSPPIFPSTFKDLSVVNLVMDDGRSGFARIKTQTHSPYDQGLVLGTEFYAIFRPE